jgi:enoyl-CoA hydratase
MGNVLVERADGGVGIITLNRPEVLNALNTALLDEYDEALFAFEQDDEISCVVITGAGDTAFSSGVDIKEAVARGREGGGGENSLGRRTWERANLKKPTIGAINGLAFGGGAMISIELDIRIGCERSRFRFPETVYGWVGATWTLPLVVGWARAKELLYTARVVEADEAARIGLLNCLVPADQLLDTGVGMARQIAQNKPAAVQGVKQVMNQHIGRAWAEMLQAERDFRAEMVHPPSATEAFQAFLEQKRRTKMG